MAKQNNIIPYKQHHACIFNSCIIIHASSNLMLAFGTCFCMAYSHADVYSFLLFQSFKMAHSVRICSHPYVTHFKLKRQNKRRIFTHIIPNPTIDYAQWHKQILLHTSIAYKIVSWHLSSIVTLIYISINCSWKNVCHTCLVSSQLQLYCGNNLAVASSPSNKRHNLC